MKIFALFAALVGLLPMLVHGDWKMPCPGTVVRERIDPIINPGAVSSHVHRVVGGSGINFTMDYNMTRHAGCSSCTVKQDKSSYWIPQLYYTKSTDGGLRYELVPDGSVNITYTQIHADGEDIHPFPEGLTMTAGNPFRRNFTGDAMSYAISFRCSDSSVHRSELPMDCKYSVIATIHFPFCWNGRDLTSDDFFSHMSYPEKNYREGKCPQTHPVRVIRLSFDFEFKVAGLNDEAYSIQPPFSLSMGDTTGYGLHGGFVNGWDTETLRSAIDTCVDVNGGDISTCHVLTQYTAEQCMDCKVPPRVDEPINDVPALPGCTFDNSKWNQDCNGSSSANIANYQTSFEDITYKSWRYLGCSSSSDPFGWNGSLVKDMFTQRSPSLTPAYCSSWCESLNTISTAWFAIHDGECVCSMLNPKPSRLPLTGFLGNCDTPCPGNQNVTCGGLNSTSLYKYCGTGECHNSEFEQWPFATKPVEKRADSATISPASSTASPDVSGVRLEEPHVTSTFVGYKVCARNPPDEPESAATLFNWDWRNVTCTIVKGFRAEAVAAAFMDWAVAEYGLNPGTKYASPEDVLDARVAQLRLEELRQQRPLIMAVESSIALIFVSIVCVIGFAALAFHKSSYTGTKGKSLADVYNDIEFATRLLDMDPAVLEMLFAKYAAMKQEREQTVKMVEKAAPGLLS
ncbi:hypothetical protein DIS24_g5957 [Lasiodiplodia hormozganensis]|uniref:WSC domain-containing protein n=1 Tax=Lasiodiplodia hormozganensis TaxID=869390 RepID=A0AA40CY58_9PEZI|nr:hypothetical protein DIS24_g5957 [Lasiodiplodia hormozganensis]